MKKNLLMRLALTCIITLCSTMAFATQYCHETLTSGSNSINLTCQSTGTDQYQILIEGTGLTGLGGSFMNVNGTGGYYINGDHCTVSADGTSITINISSTSEPSFYTPLYVMMPGEVNFGIISDITWGTCGSAATDTIAPVLGACSLVGTPTFNSATIAVAATDDQDATISTYMVNDIANGITNRSCTAANGEIVVNGLAVNTTYNLTINAKDNAGNLSANDTTITFTTANRSSECSGSKGHFGNPTVTKISYEISYQGGGITYTIIPANATDSIVYCEVQTTQGNYQATIANNQATYTQLGVATGTAMGIRFMYRLSTMAGNEMTSENVSTDDANIVYYVAGDCSTGVIIPSAPTEAAPTPMTYATGKAIAIYSDVNNQLAGTDFNPFWNQNTVVSYELIDSNNTMVYTNFNYQGIALATDVNAVNMDSLHIDIWSETAISPRIYPICHTQPNGEKSYTLNVVAGQWNSFNIPMTYFTNEGLDISGIYQFKLDNGNGEKLYIDNLYMFSISTDVDTIAPSNVTATVGTITYNSVELKLNAIEASDAITYTIYYGNLSTTTTGLSGVEKTYEVTGLDELTSYSFRIVASDASNNTSDTTRVQATTIQGPLRPTVEAPTPTIPATDVISIYSDTYTAACEWIYGSWGQSTTASTYLINENNTMKLESFNYLGLELNNNVAAFDASEMTHLHIDIWAPAEATFQITPIWVGEALYTCTPITPETWNSFDIALTNFTNINLENIYQIKMAGSGIVYLDNIFFYKEQETAVENPTVNAQIYTRQGVVYINQLNNQEVTVFNTQGQMIYSNAQTEESLSIELPKGVYIIKVGQKASKIVL